MNERPSTLDDDGEERQAWDEDRPSDPESSASSSGGSESGWVCVVFALLTMLGALLVVSPST